MCHAKVRNTPEDIRAHRCERKAPSQAIGGLDWSGQTPVDVTEGELLRFVIEQATSIDATEPDAQFKVNKLHHVIGALVTEDVVAPASQAAKKALDHGMRGHISVAEFEWWWPQSRLPRATE